MVNVVIRGIRAGVSSRAAWFAAVALSIVLCAPIASFLSASSEVTWTGTVTDDLNYGRVQSPSSIATLAGFLPNQDGLYLNPGVEGRLVYRIAKSATSRAAAALWVYMSSPSISGELRIRAGDSSRVIPSPYYNGEVVGLDGEGSATIDLEFDAKNNSAAPLLVVDQIVWGLETGAPPAAPTALSYLSFGFLAALIALPVVGRVPRKWLVVAAIGALMALTAATRFGALAATSRSPLPLDPDAVVYRVYAESFRWWPPWVNGLFSASFGEREPFFPLVVHLYFDALGASDFHLRVVSSTLSVLAVPLVLVAARRRLGWGLALAIAAAVVVARPLVDESVRGLRTELEMCAVLILYALLDRTASVRWPTTIAIGLVGAALVLTRTFYLPMVLVAVCISFVARQQPRPALRPIALAFAIVLLAAGGHRLAMFERYGDAFYDTARYARWLANVEKFTLEVDLPHPELFPGREEYESRGPYFGPEISYAQYLFVLHTWPDFLNGSLAGLADVVTNPSGLYLPGAGPALAGYPLARDALAGLLRVADVALRALAVLGVIALIYSAWRRHRVLDLLIPSMIIFGLSFSAFLYHLHLIERYRNTVQFYPLALIAAGWLVQELATHREWLGAAASFSERISRGRDPDRASRIARSSRGR